MEINKMKSSLKMYDLYFSECKVLRSGKVENGEYRADLQRNIHRKDNRQHDIELKLTVEKEDISVLVVANATFSYEADNYDIEDAILEANTIAIMFPFIRSQVTLLTTQPGMAPIVLPPINTTKFIE